MLNHTGARLSMNLQTRPRDVASECLGGAAPPGNLPAPPRNFAHHTFLGKFKSPTNLLAA